MRERVTRRRRAASTGASVPTSVPEASAGSGVRVSAGLEHSVAGKRMPWISTLRNAPKSGGPLIQVAGYCRARPAAVATSTWPLVAGPNSRCHA
jgi:hypothetical protein